MNNNIIGFKKLTNEKEKKIVAGIGTIAAIATLVPLGISVFNTLIGGIRTLQSQRGEIKLKDTNYKWENDLTYSII
ncbi:MAG: hypothetical protein ACRCRP_00665 [Metamycoplasmataceae bacterium]